MKIAIIGAGFTGLSAAYELLKHGHSVVIFEKDSQPGGLAIGYQTPGWEWTLEKHYHHWFTNDESVLGLAKELSYDVLIKRPKTAMYIDGKNYQLDSPLALLTFPKLPLVDRIRMGFIFAVLFRFNPFWQPLEKCKASTVLPKLIGNNAYSLLWKPQLENKMGEYTKDISLAWFWARLNKRTPSLAYPKAGYLSFANRIVEHIQQQKGEVLFSTEIQKLEEKNNSVTVTIKTKTGDKQLSFDAAIVTLPTSYFLKIAPQLPQRYKDTLIPLQGLGAVNLVLRLKKQFLQDGTYWLSICENSSPIMVIVEHTNFMDKSHYNNEHIIYVGNYMKTSDKRFTYSKEQLLKEYKPLLNKIHPDFEKDIIAYEAFKAPFAQPIVPINYSSMIPPFTTPLPHVYLANMQQVYPWDRGTNYAVELGKKIAKKISNI